MDQWNGEQRAVAIKMFYVFGFFKSSRFFGHPVLKPVLNSGARECGVDSCYSVWDSAPLCCQQGISHAPLKEGKFIYQLRSVTVRKVGRDMITYPGPG
jgi:hypothetical protein